jgi:hypothetical protein
VRLRERLHRWLHRHCWREWIHPRNGRRFLYKPDPACPDVEPYPANWTRTGVVIPLGARLVLATEGVPGPPKFIHQNEEPRP